MTSRCVECNVKCSIHGMVSVSVSVSVPGAVYVLTDLLLDICGVMQLTTSSHQHGDRGSQFISAVKQSIGFTIGFHNHGEGPY